VALAAGTLTLVSGAAAEAHVQVIPDSTAAGTEITKLTFRVPNESASAGFTALSVALPTTTPFAEVLAEPVDGWTAVVTEGKLPKPVVLDGTTLTQAPIKVTWTASKGHPIAPGQFQEFALSAGPIPTNAKELSFPATQTYSDGKVVRWDQAQPKGADEPEYPLPSFTVTPAQPDGTTASAAPASGTSGSGTSTSSSDSTARALAAGGLVAGVLGLVLGGLALAGARKAGAQT
jgi:uncharacterized protein YcnI